MTYLYLLAATLLLGTSRLCWEATKMTKGKGSWGMDNELKFFSGVFCCAGMVFLGLSLVAFIEGRAWQ
jgi:hypothetical protein